MLYRKATGGVWYVKFKHRGEVIRKSTGETDRRKAEIEGRRLRVDHEQTAGPGGRQTGVAMSTLGAHDIERALAEGADPATRGKTLEWIWTRVIEHFGDTDIATITYDSVLAYIGARRRKGARGQTIRREVQAVKRGMLLALRRGWVSRVPDQWPKIKSDPADEKQRGKLVPPEVLALVLGELHDDARDEACFAALTGLRAAEIKRVRASWVEPLPKGSATPALLRIPAASAKTRRERIVGLPQEALDIIRKRINAKPESEHVFSQENHKRAYREAAHNAGVPRVTLRDLRHTYATIALATTGDAVAVQEALGHTDLRTTQRYQSSTVARTVSASAGVASALGLSAEGSPERGHPEAAKGKSSKKSTRARSSFGQSTGLLSARGVALSCECCAEKCRAVHGISHTCEVEGARSGVTLEQARILEFPRLVRASGGAR